MSSPLSFSPVSATSSFEETEHLFRRELVDSRIINADSRGSFGVVMNGVSIGGSSLSFLEHHSAYEIDCGDIEDHGSVIFGLGFERPSATSFNGKRIILTENAAVITNHTRVRHERSAGCCELVLKSPVRDIENRLQAVLDRPVTRELLFNNSVRLDHGIGAHGRSTLFYILNSLDAQPTLLNNPLIAANYEDLMLGVILSLPNNYSDELLEPGGRSTAPATVSRAEEFIEANAQLAITIADVLLNVGCSRKALFANFRKFRGYTPGEFLVNTRLKLAHKRLGEPADSDSVTSIAYDSGFSHMGRFSSLYSKRYGVKPSDTLKRAGPGLSDCGPT